MTATTFPQSIAAADPVRYRADLEQPEPDEAETIQGLTDALHKVSATVYEDSGHAERSVHAKSHALLRGVLTVDAGLPATLAQGIFKTPGSYEVIMRFSTNPGDILNDKVSTPRGLAVKVLGVEGDRLPGSEEDTSQDFVMQNAKAFTVPTPKAFLKNLKMLAGTTDKAPGMKQALSAVLRGLEKGIEAMGGESGTVKSLGGHPLTNLLGETYTTVVPLRYGDYVAKIAVVPVSPGLVALKDAPVDLDDKPDGLREAMQTFFATQSAEWEIQVQLCTNLETMPIEDASREWPEDESPFVRVATIRVDPQPAWTDARHALVDDSMAFGPWKGVVEHQPLGGVMRARKSTYTHSMDFRSQANGCPMHRLEKTADLPD